MWGPKVAIGPILVQDLTKLGAHLTSLTMFLRTRVPNTCMGLSVGSMNHGRSKWSGRSGFGQTSFHIFFLLFSFLFEKKCDIIVAINKEKVKLNA